MLQLATRPVRAQKKTVIRIPFERFASQNRYSNAVEGVMNDETGGTITFGNNGSNRVVEFSGNDTQLENLYESMREHGFVIRIREQRAAA